MSAAEYGADRWLLNGPVTSTHRAMNSTAPGGVSSSQSIFGVDWPTPRGSQATMSKPAQDLGRHAAAHSPRGRQAVSSRSARVDQDRPAAISGRRMTGECELDRTGLVGVAERIDRRSERGALPARGAEHVDIGDVELAHIRPTTMCSAGCRPREDRCRPASVAVRHRRRGDHAHGRPATRRC